MNAAIAACAASGLEVAWHGINWAECYVKALDVIGNCDFLILSC
jgi:hypothetical protein